MPIQRTWSTFLALMLLMMAAPGVSLGSGTPATCTVTFAAGKGGSLSSATAQTVPYGGAAIGVAAFPAAGYAFLNWTGTAGFAATTANPVFVTKVTAAMTITANFTNACLVTFTAGPGGTLTGATPQAVQSGGATTPVKAVPAAGDAFVNWTGTGGFATTTANPLQVANVKGSQAITANFAHYPVISSFYATAGTIGPGQTAVLNWSPLAFTASASIDHGVGTVGTGSGMVLVHPAATTTYVMTATNAAGTTTSSVTITVAPPPTITAFTATPATVASGKPTTLAWTSTGATTFMLTPGPGSVTGTSTTVTPPAGTTIYTLTARNSSGSVTAQTTVVACTAPSALGYAANPVVYTRNVPLHANLPNYAGTITAFSVAPALPPGLLLNASTGALTGTPTTPRATASYTVQGSSVYGSTKANLVITVNEAPPAITYPGGPFTFTAGNPASLAPASTGGAVATWAIAPALPTGLTFSPATGQIAGTPAAKAALQIYGVTATNAGGSSIFFFSITIAPVPPPPPTGPVITLQPFGQILVPGQIPTFSVTATGTGALYYQWYRKGAAIPGATASTYAAPAFQAADDGTPFTVVVREANGTTTTTSAPAVVSLLHDLATWLKANPSVAATITWQFQPASANVYQAPAATDLVAWANWSASQQADLEQAYLAAAAWYAQGAPPVSMVPGGPDPTDEPVNLHPSVNDDTQGTLQEVSPAYFWKLYVANVAFTLMLETTHQLPWSITAYPASTLRWLFDSSTLAWLLPNGTFAMGTYDEAGLPTLRAHNRPRTTFADPRWTYRWLRQAGIIGPTRLATLGATLDWMRLNLTHFYGSDEFGNDFAIWQYRGYSPISRMVAGTVDTLYPGYGSMHWTAGCHGSTGFMNAVLRVLAIPVQPVWVCGHEMPYFPSEDLYMDHGDDPYNQIVKASTSSSLELLIPSATWRARFGSDETVNILGDSGPALAWVGYTAVHFQ